MTREQIETILAGCEGVEPGPWIIVNEHQDASIRPEADAGPDIWTEVTKISFGCENEDDWSAKNAQHFRRLDPDTVRELCRRALVGLDAEARAEIMNHAGFVAGQKAMRERAAKAARKATEQSGDCVCLSGMDMETGARECKLERRGGDCLCIHREEAGEDAANEIEKLAIRALPIEGEEK